VSALPAKKAPTYRAFESTDIIAAHALSLAVGWPHRAEDWQSMFAAGSGFVAQDDGEVIGTALYWKCGTDRGTLGLVIVSPEAQGRGIGRQLMELVLKALGNRVTFLHATPAGKPLYERLGFEACGTVDQHQGVVSRVRSVTTYHRSSNSHHVRAGWIAARSSLYCSMLRRVSCSNAPVNWLVFRCFAALVAVTQLAPSWRRTRQAMSERRR
jgi:GNAT superfamily N-acetyltransferase